VGGGGPIGEAGSEYRGPMIDINTSFTLHYHKIKNGSSRKGNVAPIFAYCNFAIAVGALA
jgi:hypothetical protein